MTHMKDLHIKCIHLEVCVRMSKWSSICHLCFFSLCSDSFTDMFLPLPLTMITYWFFVCLATLNTLWMWFSPMSIFCCLVYHIVINTSCRHCEMITCLSVNQLSMQKEVNGITCCLKQTSFYLAQGTSYFWKADFILWMSLRWMHFTQFNNLIQPTLTAFIFVNRHHAGHFGRCRF